VSKQIIAAFIVAITVVFASCKENEPDLYANEKDTYFSLKHFALDEYSNYALATNVFEKKTTVDGKVTDTAIMNIRKMDWDFIVNTFLKADIGTHSFLGKYKFTQFDDNTDNTHDYMYIAYDKNAYTQKLLITTDLATNKVRGLYIETDEHSLLKDVHQKLFYAPMSIIQIQQDENPLVGKKTHTVIEYDVKG